MEIRVASFKSPQSSKAFAIRNAITGATLTPIKPKPSYTEDNEVGRNSVRYCYHFAKKSVKLRLHLGCRALMSLSCPVTAFPPTRAQTVEDSRWDPNMLAQKAGHESRKKGSQMSTASADKKSPMTQNWNTASPNQHLYTPYETTLSNPQSTH